MYPQELEKLIEYALVDGEVSPKEREILLRKSTELGIDPAEFEMVLDARIYEIQQKKSNRPEPGTPLTTNSSNENLIPEEAALKCPSCKSPVDGFVTNCSYCGSDLSQKASNQSIQTLLNLLSEAEDGRANDSNNPFSAVGKFYSDAFSSISGPSKVDRKKMEIIASFPIPTTQEDIFEFLTLAIPRAKTLGNFFTKNSMDNKVHNLFAPVWKNKCEQIVLKARVSMQNNPEALNTILELVKELD